MTTTATDTTDASPRPSTTGLVRALGAGTALLVAVHYVLVLIYVPRWPEATELVSWSAVAVPAGMLALTAAMWLARAASRILLLAQLLTAGFATVVYVLGAATGDEFFALEIEMWAMVSALVAQYLVALGVLARGTWRGLLRVLPIVGASWGTVVLPIAVAVEDLEATWWPLISIVCGGLILNGLAVAILTRRARPSS